MNRLRIAAVALTVVLAGCPGGDEGPVAPPAPVVTSVTVSPATSTLTSAGATVQLQATARDQSGNVLSGQTVTWSTSATGVATVNTSGLVTAVANGSAAITATIAGVAGSAAITVSLPQQQACANPITVSLSAGQAASFAGTDCIVLPSGSSGDRYRVIVTRPTETGGSSDTTTATLKVTGLGVTAAPPTGVGALQAPLGPLDFPGLAPAEVRRAIRVAEATERFHAQLRAREEAMLRAGIGTLRLGRSPSRATSAQLAERATSPAKITLDESTASNCSTTVANKKTAILLHENDDLVVYQDSTQNATKPVSTALAQRLTDYYTSHGKKVIEDYFGKPSDINRDGKVLVFISPVVTGDVAAFVWSGDFFTTASCAASNEREMMYFNADLILALGSGGSQQALETVVHEMKHVVSLYHRIAASLRIGSAQYHPTWIEEGTAEIAGEMSSRVAWASIGGPAVNAQVTRQSFVNTGTITAENYGVAIKLARVAWYLSSQPNGLIVTPDGAQSGASVYGSGWLFHRWLGDAFGQAASAPQRDAALFKVLNDSLTDRGTAGIVRQTGRSFLDLFDEFTKTVSLHGTSAPSPSLNFSTYDFVTAAEIFCNPNPLGVFPWPVTTTGTAGDCNANPRVNESSNPSASFATKDYAGRIGPTGMRVHDFLSNGSGTGAQIQLSMTGPSKIWVVRLR